MVQVLRAVQKLFELVYRVAVWLAQVLLVAMVLLIGTNVFMRYVLNSGIFWSEEIALVMSVWFIFIALPMGVRKRLHISIHLFRNPAPWLERSLTFLGSAVALVVGYVLLRYGWILIEFTSRSIMPATQLPSSVLYAVLPVSAVLLIYEAVTDLLGIETDPPDEQPADDTPPATSTTGGPS